ncbi:hypothetical protein WJ45_11180 [Burkholderia ubonensis]|nr:hypothetical protein WJ45_11180 [Burkholderia ubonensis]KVQ60347.1 hypothetical protein WK04_26305 [Burkholderia ubonensis]
MFCRLRTNIEMHHVIKPRARQLSANLWKVHANGLEAFDSTLDGALLLWRRCFLLHLIDSRNARA